MYQPLHPQTTTSAIFTGRWARTQSLLFLALAGFALSPLAHAVSPPPDGNYPNFNTAEGEDALFMLGNGSDNTAIGFNALYRNSDGNRNTATGSRALFFNVVGNDNTAVGFRALEQNNNGLGNAGTGSMALQSNTNGSYNAATGFMALQHNSTGFYNTANGAFALQNNTEGTSNTATGDSALKTNTTGNYNTANGIGALQNNSTGASNTADGASALLRNTSGKNNTASGSSALANNTTGNWNTANGYTAMFKNNTGSFNTALGFEALANNTGGVYNTAIGLDALVNNSGSSNIGVGYAAGSNLTTGKYNIDIGALGTTAESNTIRIGRSGVQTAAYIQGIFGATVASGAQVMVDSSGQLGTMTSSARFKEAIKPMNEASESLLALKPVTFRYKHGLDPDGVPQFGLVAEEVEKVDPALVLRDATGKVNTVRYEAVNAMLLNEFLKEHRTVEQLRSVVAKQEETIAQQQKNAESGAAELHKEIAALTASLKEQAAQVQKVSAQFALIKTPSQFASSDE
jgi:hypothetical protein